MWTPWNIGIVLWTAASQIPTSLFKNPPQDVLPGWVSYLSFPFSLLASPSSVISLNSHNFSCICTVQSRLKSLSHKSHQTLKHKGSTVATKELMLLSSPKALHPIAPGSGPGGATLCSVPRPRSWVAWESKDPWAGVHSLSAWRNTVGLSSTFCDGNKEKYVCQRRVGWTDK